MKKGKEKGITRWDIKKTNVKMTDAKRQVRRRKSLIINIMERREEEGEHKEFLEK